MESIPEVNTLESQVRQAYLDIKKEGIDSPDQLNTAIPEVAAANSLFEQWATKLDEAAGEDPKLLQLANLKKTTFYVDLGFSSRPYLLDVKTWLATDIDDAVDDAVRQKIQEQIDKIEGLLAKTE